MEKNIKAYIYIIENSINHKVYVGFTINLQRRFAAHKALAFNCNSPAYNKSLYTDMRFYGKENFIFSSIYESFDYYHTLNVMEKFFIEEYNSLNSDFGYNNTSGGQGTYKSPRPKSLEFKRLMSERMKGENNSRYGITMSQEQKIMLSEKSKIQAKLNPLIGSKNGMFGKQHPDEWRKNHSNIMRMRADKHINEIKHIQFEILLELYVLSNEFPLLEEFNSILKSRNLQKFSRKGWITYGKLKESVLSYIK